MTIQELRNQGELDSAMSAFLAAADRSDFDRILRQHLFGERDLVAEWAAFMFGNRRRQECPPVIQQLKSKIAGKLGAVQWQFRARLELIERLAADAGQPDSLQATKQAVLNYLQTFENQETGWAYQKYSQIRDLETSGGPLAVDPSNFCNGPAFLDRLPDDASRRMFAEIAGGKNASGKNVGTDMDVIGWTHPGLQMAGELIAYLENGGDRSKDNSGDSEKPVLAQTWVLFAARSEGRSFGILAQLTIEPVAGGKHGTGKGLLLPDPLAGGYLRMTGSFSLALQRAWYAVWQHRWNGMPGGHDFRWKIELAEAIEGSILAKILLLPALDGHSGEVALACALLAANAGELLDRNTVASARFTDTIQSNLELDTVGKLDAKTQSDRLDLKKICEIIVSDKQTDVSLDFGTSQMPIKSGHLDAAYSQFTQYGKITRVIKQGLAKRAAAQISEFCGPEIPAEHHNELGSNYVPSPVSERYPREELGEDGRLKKPRPLDNRDREAFMLGKWRSSSCNMDDPVRMQLFATSGMGKTIQLTAMERAISQENSSVIPIRIGKASGIKSPTSSIKNQLGLITLSDIGWSGDRDQVLKQIWQQHLAQFLRVPHGAARISDDHGCKWLMRAAEVGNLWFLFDALDQTTMPMDGLRAFLLTVRDCPVLVAGRRESLATKAELFENQYWVTLELVWSNCPLLRRRICR